MNMTKKQRNLTFAVLLVSSIGTSLLQTALTTALPSMMRDLSISAATAQWLTSVYSLTVGIMVPATAYLIKRFPTRKLFLSAVTLFAAGTLLAIVTPTFSLLMVARVMQAMGNGIVLPMTQVVVLTIYPVEQRGTVMGIYGLAVGAAPVVAPTLAGIIIDLWSWRTIFEIVLVIVTVDILMALKVMRDITETEYQSFDVLSMLLCTVSFSGILLGLGNLGAADFISLQVGFPLLVGAAALVLFSRRQLRLETPFLELRVLKVKDYLLAVIISMLLYAVMMAGSTLFPIYIQTVCGKSATVSGLIMMPGSLVMALISPFTGRFYDKFGIRKLVVGGSLLMLLSCFGVVFVNADTSVFYIASVYILRLIAIGCIMMPVVTWGMSVLGPENTAHGTALLTSLRTISGAFGSAVFVAVMSKVTELTSSQKGVAANAAGIDFAFAGITAVAAVLFVVCVFCVREQKFRGDSVQNAVS